MTDLIAFLRARLDEDEQTAKGLLTAARIIGRGPDFYGSGGPAAQAHWQRHDPARVLAEVDAKRRMVDEYSTTIRIRDEASARIKAAWPKPNKQDLDTWNRTHHEESVMRDWVRLLALPYAGHPEYRESWQPGPLLTVTGQPHQAEWGV